MIIQATSVAALLVMAVAQPLAKPDGAYVAIDASLRACGQWLLEPKTWAQSIEGFPNASGLSTQIEPQASVPDFALPPVSVRRGMHHWRAPIGKDAGIYVTVSDQTPICHVVGGAANDLQPAVESVLASEAFKRAWSSKGAEVRGDLRTEQFTNREDHKLTLIVTRAAAGNDRTDRPQFVATAQYNIGK